MQKGFLMNYSENNNKQLMTGKRRKDKERRVVRHTQAEDHAHIRACGLVMMGQLNKQNTLYKDSQHSVPLTRWLFLRGDCLSLQEG